MSNTGIVYNLTGEQSRGNLTAYHQKPSPLLLNRTKWTYDIQGIPKMRQAKLLMQRGGEVSSRFTIGIEVEKTSLHRDAVREYELFCGFERDNSCGFEAVTHILPLLPKGIWRTKVYDMMHKASKIIEDTYSPSNKSCGGHITLGVDGMTGKDILSAVRGYSGLILALFRYRLTNKYCGLNTNMRTDFYSSDRFDANDTFANTSPRYQLALVKGDLLEFRVVSRYESVKQMMRRYELFFELLDFAINVKGSFGLWMKRARPIIIEMYDGDIHKAEEILNMARHFQKFIDNGVIHQDIKKYLFV